MPSWLLPIDFATEGTVRQQRSHLCPSARVTDTPGLGPIRHDIQMTKGVVVTGRIIDVRVKENDVVKKGDLLFVTGLSIKYD